MSILDTLRPADGEEISDIGPFLGSSDGIRSLALAATRSATADKHILIEGELGTGKSALARWLYRNSPTSLEPLIEFDCRRLRRSHGETGKALAELNGYRPSSLPSVPERGTVLIRHLERMDSHTQARFLRAVGCGASLANEANKTAARLRFLMTRERASTTSIAANASADLATRLASVTLAIPPLRQRPQDLPIIAFHLLQQISRELGAGEFDLTRGAIRLLQSYPWPGNIRELRSVLHRAVLAAKTNLLAPPDLVFNVYAPEVVPTTAPLTLKELERQHIERVLHDVGGRVQVAAKLLGLPRSSLYHKLKQYKNAHLSLPAAS